MRLRTPNAAHRTLFISVGAARQGGPHLRANGRNGVIPLGHGFTLIELLMVLIILGILAASAAPAFTDSLMFHRVESAALRLKNDLQLARQTALTKSAPCTLQFTTSTAYTLSNATSLDHAGKPYAVDMSKSPYTVTVTSVNFGGEALVTFNGYGLPSSDGAIVVQAGKHRRQIALDTQGNITITTL